MSIVNSLSLESNRNIKINFNGGNLSSSYNLLAMCFHFLITHNIIY